MVFFIKDISRSVHRLFFVVRLCGAFLYFRDLQFGSHECPVEKRGKEKAGVMEVGVYGTSRGS